jgi:uncharacterized protein YndB with AHSA1/START domain
MVERSSTGSGPSDERTLATSRVIEAPRQRVWNAFSDPAQLATWWGPNGFTTTFHEFDLRPGGRWRFVMHGPDGANFPNESVFVDVTPPERVIFKHESRPRFEMTITFVEQGGSTLVDWRQVFDTAAESGRVAKLAIPANEQNLDRLTACVLGSR